MAYSLAGTAARIPDPVAVVVVARIATGGDGQARLSDGDRRRACYGRP